MLSSIDFQAGAFLQRAPAFFVVILRLALYQEMKYMISIQNLYKSYPCEGGDFEALRNISINIQSGEIFGIIGLSGAGKSTLLRTLNRLEEPSSGSICIGDTDITQLSTPELRKLRRRVGMIFQHFNLLTSRTVFQNVATAHAWVRYGRGQAALPAGRSFPISVRCFRAKGSQWPGVP